MCLRLFELSVYVIFFHGFHEFSLQYATYCFLNPISLHLLEYPLFLMIIIVGSYWSWKPELYTEKLRKHLNFIISK